MQLLSPVVSRGNELHNTNSPSASLLNIRKIIRICVHALRILAEANYSKAAFISLEASNSAATIQRWGLFKGGIYLKIYGKSKTCCDIYLAKL